LKGVEKGKSFNADLLLDEASSKDYDALVLPGGIFNADRLRMNEKAQAWAVEFLDTDRLIAAVGYASLLLISADLIEEKRLTSALSLKDDIRNAGGEWANRPVVVDENLITSRGQKDIEVFSDSILKWFD
jgi:protease I